MILAGDDETLESLRSHSSFLDIFTSTTTVAARTPPMRANIQQVWDITDWSRAQYGHTAKHQRLDLYIELPGALPFHYDVGWGIGAGLDWVSIFFPGSFLSAGKFVFSVASILIRHPLRL